MPSSSGFVWVFQWLCVIYFRAIEPLLVGTVLGNSSLTRIVPVKSLRDILNFIYYMGVDINMLYHFIMLLSGLIVNYRLGNLF